MRFGVLAAAAAAMALMAGQGHASECDPGKPGADLSFAEAEAVYQCISDQLHAGYMKGSKRWIPAEYVNDYRGWVKASTAPAAPGFHGERFLVTYVNQTGADAYMAYSDDPNIPAGTLIAKESFNVTGSGKVRRGPLFIMEKVAAGTSPETGDWYYMMVSATGKPQAVNVVTACHECHQNFPGGLGYPVEEVRAAR